MTKHTIWLLTAILVGGLVPLQSSINTSLAAFLKHPLQATLINFMVGAIACAVVVFFVLGKRFPDTAVIQNIPWFLFLGGVLGVAFVTTVVVLTPRIGITNMLAGALAGQLIVSVIFDHFGLFGLQVHPVSPQRIIGIVLLITGIYLTNKF